MKLVAFSALKLLAAAVVVSACWVSLAVADDHLTTPEPGFSFVPTSPGVPTPRSLVLEQSGENTEETQTETATDGQDPEVSLTDLEIPVPTKRPPNVAVASAATANEEIDDDAASAEVEPQQSNTEQSDSQPVIASEEGTDVGAVETVEDTPSTVSTTTAVEVTELAATETPPASVRVVGEAKPEVLPEAEAIEPETVAPKSEPVADDAQQVESEAAQTEEEDNTLASLFAPQASTVPKELTPELLEDPRLKDLPQKPTADLDLQSVIAIRYHSLKILESGECSGIADGGKSLSSPGWIFVKCSDLPIYRQFPKE